MENAKYKTLIITAHPASHGLTHGIGKVLKEKREEGGGEVEILDLYKTDLKQDYLVFENIREIPDTEVKAKIREKISGANELVFIHPLWWMTMPAILKNFLDQNLTPRFAYQYINGKRVGLLSGKTARVYITCDGPIWAYALMAFPFFLSWICGTLAFCGIMVDKCHLIRNRAFQNDEERAIYLQKVKVNANKKSMITRFISYLVINIGI